MQFQHLFGGFVLAMAAAGLGALVANPILIQLGRSADAQSAWEIGLLFLLPFSLPALFTLFMIGKTIQARKLRELADEHSDVLLQRYRLLTQPNRYGLIELRKWSDEVWEFRQSLPIGLPFLNQAAALRIVTEHITALAARVAPEHQSAFTDPPSFARYVGAELMRLGWTAKLITGKTKDDVHVLAEKSRIRALVLCCPSGAIGNAQVQRAVQGRSRVGADLAAIVANDDFSTGARALARHTRVGLLHLTEIKNIHRAAGRLWRARLAKTTQTAKAAQTQAAPSGRAPANAPR